MSNETRIPTQNRSKKTKEKIINAALKLFSKDGYHNTNTALIAKEADISTGSIYMYYKNKKEIFIDVNILFFNIIANDYNSDELFQNIQKLTGRGKVKLFIDTLYQSHLKHNNFHKEVISLMLIDKDIRELNKKLDNIVIDKLIKILMKSKNILKITDFKIAAKLLYTISEEVIHSITLNDHQENTKKYLKELEDMICAYLFK